VPLIEVECSGTGEIATPPPPPPPPPPPTDAGPGGSSDAHAGGVTCISKQRVIVACIGTCTCTQSTTTETDVHFWAVPGTVGGDPEGALAADSPGLHAVYNTSDPSAALFHATDASHTRYNGYNPDYEYILRNGNTIEVHERAGRSGSAPIGCEDVPLIDVTCSGTTTLGN